MISFLFIFQSVLLLSMHQQNKYYKVMKQLNNKDSNYRRVKLISQFSGLDVFLIKKPAQCTIRIPDTIFLDRNGCPKDWIFNSDKLPHHPILKKRRQNLHAITIIKNFCNKFVPNSSIVNIKTIPELKQIVRTLLMQRKDAEFANRKKNIQITTIHSGILPLNILEFLDYIGTNKNSDQNFYDKWKMIQERVSNSKHDESYRVESIRRNHLIESKSQKITVLNHYKEESINLDGQVMDISPSKQMQANNDKKQLQGFKFFDSYLNKKFFSAVQELIECIQKNYKCVIDSIKTRFVIDANRQPHLVEIEEMYVKPSTKLFNMRQFKQCILAGEIKLDAYARCLNQFLIENNVSSQPNLEQPLYEQKRYKCRGEFCGIEQKKIGFIAGQYSIKLPLISGSFNSRKVSSSFIESVGKKRDQVIQKLKEAGMIEPSYVHENVSDSQYEDTEQKIQANVKVCENCFIFYLNVMKFYDIDAFGSLVQRKATRSAYSKTPHSGRKKSNQLLDEQENDHLLMDKHREQMKSLNTLRHRTNNQDEKESSKNSPLKRSISMATKLKAIKLPQEEKEGKTQLIKEKIQKEKEKEKQKQKQFQNKKNLKIISKSHKLIEAKLKNANNIGQKLNKFPIETKAVKAIHKNAKVNTFEQALQQLIAKIQNLPYNNQEQFIRQAKKYYKANLPQVADRISFSNHYQSHLYEFMNNTTISVMPSNRIKKRPEMSLKRLSQLTNYPQIVSRSAFIFDTLICDEKTTIPFCVISSKMIHNNNSSGKPYKNIIVVQDIFDSYIEHIAMSKELLQDLENTRFILFNYPGQSHTIYDKNGVLRTSEFIAIIDKLMFRLATFPNQLNIIGKEDSIQLIGIGYGGYLVQSYLSACPSTHSLIKGAMIVNSSPYCTKKYKEIFQSLISLYEVEDIVTEQNAFLYYNKAINSIQVSNEDIENKAGLNSIRTDGRVYLLKSALNTWDWTSVQHFSNYEQKVMLVFSKANIMLTKTDMQKLLIKPDLQKTQMKNRKLIQIDGGLDVLAQNYDGMNKYMLEFIKS